MTVTRSELQAWLDTWNENHAAPSADSVVDFLGIELAPEPATPVGQRRRSPSGVEVVKTDNGFTEPWRKYRGRNPGPTWFADVEVADWEVITDAPEVPEDIIAAVTCLITETGESLQGSRGIARRMADAGLLVGTTPEAPKCDREHLPRVIRSESAWRPSPTNSSRNSPREPGAPAAPSPAQPTARGNGAAEARDTRRSTTVWSTELDLSPDAN